MRVYVCACERVCLCVIHKAKEKEYINIFMYLFILRSLILINTGTVILQRLIVTYADY